MKHHRLWGSNKITSPRFDLTTPVQRRGFWNKLIFTHCFSPTCCWVPSTLNEAPYARLWSPHMAEAIVDKRLKLLFKWGLAGVVQRLCSSFQKWLSFCCSKGEEGPLRPRCPWWEKRTDKVINKWGGVVVKRDKNREGARKWEKDDAARQTEESEGGESNMDIEGTPKEKGMRKSALVGLILPWADEMADGWGGARDKSQRGLRPWEPLLLWSVKSTGTQWSTWPLQRAYTSKCACGLRGSFTEYFKPRTDVRPNKKIIAPLLIFRPPWTCWSDSAWSLRGSWIVVEWCVFFVENVALWLSSQTSGLFCKLTFSKRWKANWQILVLAREAQEMMMAQFWNLGWHFWYTNIISTFICKNVQIFYVRPWVLTVNLSP